ncbi:UNKNOWN [Stylonychia lemnae]|uniref:Uncharacterized protein n=1 Tax=Stylonychia lemnae TaxID=5949 RepID=A0A077ZP03_STYLE|nr:UNKNOWN [Stylonychia lemnae]|eukprot:CDW71110.1 UNKNOWN [Stylonychia lemnae]
MQNSQQINSKFILNKSIDLQLRKNEKQGALSSDYQQSQIANSLKSHMLIKEFDGVLFGAQTSTFDRQKDSLTKQMIKRPDSQLPFYAWQCLSFKTLNRTVDFVIKDNQQIFQVISVVQLLMSNLQQVKQLKRDLKRKYQQQNKLQSKMSKLKKSVSKQIPNNQANLSNSISQDQSFISSRQYDQGDKSTRVGSLENSFCPEIQNESKNIKNGFEAKFPNFPIDMSYFSKKALADIEAQIRMYKLMRIKMKISYEACHRRTSVLETFLRSIYLTYKNLYINKLSIPNNKPINEILDESDDSRDEEPSYVNELNSCVQNQNKIRNQINQLKVIEIFKRMKSTNKYSNIKFCLKKLYISRENLKKTIYEKERNYFKIPQEFRLRKLSQSYWFYDPLKIIIEEVINNKSISLFNILISPSKFKQETRSKSFINCMSVKEKKNTNLSANKSIEQSAQFLVPKTQDTILSKDQIEQTRKEILHKQIFVQQLANLSLKNSFIKQNKEFIQKTGREIPQEINHQLVILLISSLYIQKKQYSTELKDKRVKVLKKVKRHRSNEKRKIQVLNEQIDQEIKYFTPVYHNIVEHQIKQKLSINQMIKGNKVIEGWIMKRQQPLSTLRQPQNQFGPITVRQLGESKSFSSRNHEATQDNSIVRLSEDSEIQVSSSSATSSPGSSSRYSSCILSGIQVQPNSKLGRYQYNEEQFQSPRQDNQVFISDRKRYLLNL